VSHLHSLMSTLEAESEVADVSRHRNMSAGKSAEQPA
jgi:GTP pyrophosphokinase/guanosine-3',5'-bis(diphosphate) 3'-pyrophosphohydrolase